MAVDSGEWWSHEPEGVGCRILHPLTEGPTSPQTPCKLQPLGY